MGLFSLVSKMIKWAVLIALGQGFLFLEIGLFAWLTMVFGISTMIVVGLMPTLMGLILLRYQYFLRVKKIKCDFKNGVLPEVKGLNVVFLLPSGILLLMPGLITDIIGGMLLIPMIQDKVLSMLLNRLKQ